MLARENAKDKPHPQPGDAVPWAEVEDGALYHRKGRYAPFRMVLRRTVMAIHNEADSDVFSVLGGLDGASIAGEDGFPESPLVLVARDLGSAPEAWRAAMREWTANGNRPSVDPKPLSYAVTSREDAT